MFKEKLRKMNDYEWELPKGAKSCMIVPARLILSEKLLKNVEDGAVEQIANIACLPGVQKYALAMPDMHFGYSCCFKAAAAKVFL